MAASRLPSRPEAAALVPAAGRGERLGLGPKGWLRIGGETLLARLLDTLRRVVGRIYLAVPPHRAADIPVHAGDVVVVSGGDSRQETVRRLLEAGRETWLLIADAARPFATAALVERVLDAARPSGAAVPVMKPSIPGLIPKAGWVRASLATGTYGLPQSPQAYRRDVLTFAYARAARGDWRMQTTHELVLRAGARIAAVPGEEANIKITTLLDWEIARRVIARQGTKADTRHEQ